MKKVIVSGSFDDIRTSHIAFLRTAAEYGSVNLVLWPDEMHKNVYGAYPRFNLQERLYFTESIKYIDTVITVNTAFDPDRLPEEAGAADYWLVFPEDQNDSKKAYCRDNGPALVAAGHSDFKLNKYAEHLPDSDGKKIVVTGCYDYFHTGHIRFFEEVSEYGELYVIIGSDRNVEMLKGEGHPHYSEDERLFIVQSIKYVKGACISTGSGWMDAEPEIKILKPDIYAVNEDGDKPEKREFCEKYNLQYLILKRTPKEGLPVRSSTELRGF